MTTRGRARTIVLVAVAASAALRVWILLTPAAQLDGDEAVTGMMVRRMLRGQDGYVYFAGQRWNGAIEQYVQVVMYWATRLPQNAFTLRIPEVLYWALATWLVYVVGRRVLGSEYRAAVAAAVFSIAPYWTVYTSVRTHGAYPSLILIGLGGVWCALRWRDDSRLRWPLGLGLAIGLLLWNGLTGYELVVPALLIAVARLRSTRALAAMAGGAVAGAAPMLYFTARHHIFPPVDSGLWVVPTTIVQRSGYFFGPILREFVGVGGESARPGWPLILQWLVLAAILSAVAWALWRRRHSVADIVRLRGADPVTALLVSFPIVAAIFIASPDSWNHGQPRYLFAYSPVLVWLLAAIDPPGLPPRWRPALAAALVVVMGATSITMTANRASTPPGASDRQLSAAISYLRSHDERYVYAPYFTAMPLQYLAGGDIVASPIEGGQAKFPVNNKLVYDSGQVVYINSTRGISGFAVRHVAIEPALRAHGVSYQTHRFGDAVIFDHLSPALTPWQLGIGMRGPT